MSRALRAFAPIENKTQTYAASAVAQNSVFTTKLQLGNGSVFLQDSSSVFPNNIQVDNQTGVAIFVKASLSTAVVAATVNDYEVKAGDIKTIDVGQFDNIQVLPSASATGSVYIKRGIGGL